MGWADKELKKHEVSKMANNVMKDPRYIETLRREMEKATEKAFDSFLIISVAYMRDRLKFGRERILKFIDYAVEQMHFAEELPDYFSTMNEAILDETGVDILRNCIDKGNEVERRKGRDEGNEERFD